MRLEGCVTLWETGGLSHYGEQMSTFQSTDCHTSQFEAPGAAAGAPGTLWDAVYEATFPLSGTLGAHQQWHQASVLWTSMACTEHQNKPLKPANNPWMLPEKPWCRLHLDHTVSFMGKLVSSRGRLTRSTQVFIQWWQICWRRTSPTLGIPIHWLQIDIQHSCHRKSRHGAMNKGLHTSLEHCIPLLQMVLLSTRCHHWSSYWKSHNFQPRLLYKNLSCTIDTQFRKESLIVPMKKNRHRHQACWQWLSYSNNVTRRK